MTTILSAAPELSPTVKVLWLAVHRDLAEFRSTEEWQAGRLYQYELSAEELDNFEQKLHERGCSVVIISSFQYMHGSGING